MPRNPGISVVIGAFNAQRFLTAAIDSLLAQTFEDFELIVVDDGSQDRTFQILNEFQARDPRVRPLRIPHGGIVDAANTGLKAARSDLIARADADDLNFPNRLQKQFDYLESHPEVVAVGSRMEVIEPYGSPLRITDHKLTHEEIEAEFLRGVGWALPQPTAMLRKSIALKVGGYRHNYPYSEDFDLFLRMAEAGRLANLPDVLVQYRLHPGSSNWNHHRIQMSNKTKLLSEAYARRGSTMPTGMNFHSGWDQPISERYIHWLWSALKNNDVRGARKHAWSALKSAPLSTSAWRAACCAVRGY
ncbi:MAG TPA: glycosyltransferase [Tepidisphaeraceae bacterium]|jgi:glycosyltransferase involved in cell wall biosynthesis